MGEFVDIHSHVLPAVDDGSPSIEVSLEMLRRASEENIGALVLTPHMKAGDGPEVEELHRVRFGELCAAVQEAALPVELHLGCEIAFRFNMLEVVSWPSGHLADGRYVLIDLPPGPLSPGLEQGFFELRSAGYRPILAHPERHRQLARDPEHIGRLREQDLLLQVNAGSLLGRFGARAQGIAEMIVSKGWADFVASDGHDLEKRPLTQLAAREIVAKLSGENEVKRLFSDNPRQVISNGPVVRGEDAPRQRATPPVKPRRSSKRKPSLLQRILGRGSRR
ncbi:MAG: protein-tyrosine phosphatase [Candidatus Latescibacterota bacterium]